MSHPLENVPLNTQKNFIMGTSIDGCQIYVPVHVHEAITGEEKTKLLINEKNNLQSWLNVQYERPKPFDGYDPFDPNSGNLA